MSKEHDKFGAEISGSRWFNDTPDLVETPVTSVRVTWPCPVTGCGGEMKFNGETWLTSAPGYHHTCDRCGFTAALRWKKYPTVEYR
jgi:hypothetical protein